MDKKKQKSKVIQKRPHKMSVVSEEKIRLVLACTEEKRYVKMLAAKNDMTISEYLLSFARKQMPKSCGHHCKKGHVPNKETAKVLRETDEGKNLEEHESLDEFWKSLGIDKYA